jgi:chromosome partitioning protein
VRETVETNNDIPILKCALMERAAFSEIHITGEVPRQTDPEGGPAKNLTALAQEILARIELLSKAA